MIRPAYISTFYSRPLRRNHAGGMNVSRPAWHVVTRTYRRLRQHGLSRAEARMVVDDMLYAGTTARYSNRARHGLTHQFGLVAS
jgi:hypothetical protein